MKTLDILGRRWFSKAGNTYHTAEIRIDGTRVHYSDVCYGYGDHYQQTARDWLLADGCCTGLAHDIAGYDSLHWFCRDNGIELVARAVDVGLKRDL